MKNKNTRTRTDAIREAKEKGYPEGFTSGGYTLTKKDYPKLCKALGIDIGDKK